MRSDLRVHCGVSLGQMFSGEITPDEIWDYITHLPRTSATTAAIYADPETVLSDEPGETPLTEFSPVDEKLAYQIELTQSLLANLISLGGGKPPKFKPWPRPGEARREALKAQLREQARQEWAELCAQMGVPV